MYMRPPLEHLTRIHSSASTQPVSAVEASPPTYDLSAWPEASRELLEQRELLTRIDRKFLTTREKVETFLSELGDDYHILLAGTSGWARYETCYFDTPCLEAFHEHVRGRRPRFKVRIRHHVDRGRSFLEVKEKTNAGRTVKARRPRTFLDSTLSEDDRDYIAKHCALPALQLEEAVWTNFNRATFVGKHTNERITVDLGLTFEKDSQMKAQPMLGIIEIKQPRLMHTTPAAAALRKIGVREDSVSKYCAAVAALRDDAKPRARKTVSLRLGRFGS